jgi:hypothetical protein
LICQYCAYRQAIKGDGHISRPGRARRETKPSKDNQRKLQCCSKRKGTVANEYFVHNPVPYECAYAAHNFNEQKKRPLASCTRSVLG